jgi:hypothetical protein
VHREKWNFVAAGECLELSAGFRHAVHFVLDARKKRDPRIFFHHQSAADETASVETAARGTTSFKVFVGTAETTPGLKTRSTARCTTALSSNRMQERIFSTYAGGAFRSAEIGRSLPPFSFGWKIRSSYRRQPIG